MNRRRPYLWIALAAVLAAGVVAAAVRLFHSPGGPAPRGQLEPWDAQVDLGLVSFKNVAEIPVEGFSPGMTQDGPAGSNYYKYTIKAAAGRDLFEVRTSQPAWVLWWDRNGRPQNGLHVDRPQARPAGWLPSPPWATANFQGMRATVAPGAYPLRVMVLVPGRAAADKARVLAFLKEALAKPLSEQQVAQLLEIAEEVGAPDPQVARALLDVAQGKVPVEGVQVGGTAGWQTLGPFQLPATDRRYVELRERASEVAMRLGGATLAASPGAPDPLADPNTAPAAYFELKRQNKLPSNAAQLMHQAAVKDPGTTALALARSIQEIDPHEAVLTFLDLMLHADPQVRQYAWSHNLQPMGYWPVHVLGPGEVRPRFDRITDPKIRQEWLQTVVPVALPEVVSGRRAASLLDAPGRLDPHAGDVQDVVLAAAVADDVPSLRQLVDRGATVDFHYRGDGQTILPRVAGAGAANAVGFLLDHGVTADTKEAMYEAIARGHAGVVKVLLAHGADVRGKVWGNWTPIMLAASGGNLEIIRMLVEAGADPAEGLPRATDPAVIRYLKDPRNGPATGPATRSATAPVGRP